MSRITKRRKKINEVVKEKKSTSLTEAIVQLKKCPPLKFDQTLNFSLFLGVDPKKSDQQVRGTVSLPHGTGKKVTVAVIAKGDKEAEAKEAGADFVGSDELIEKIKNGWTEFDVLISTPDLMREVGKLGKVLGPRGLMPTPKAGTVTQEVAKAIQEIKAGKVEFKIDKTCVVNLGAGKISFSEKKLEENVRAILSAISRAKPASSKGIYLKSLFLSTTMGPGIPIDIQSV